MKLLILGGTHFLGRHLVDAARSRGHDVVLFHRGQTNPDLFADVEHILGDRDGGLEALKGRPFDAVIDTCGYVPRVVRASAALLSGVASHYAFVSSISVYADTSQPGIDESSPVAELADPADEDMSGGNYGALKAACERAVDDAFAGTTLHVRPGLIVGPHDPTDRFTWWPRRMALGGDVLAPGDPAAPVQLIDARDLAAWMIRLVEAGRGGVYNATGPAQPITIGDVLEASRKEVGGDARLVWVDEKFLLENDVPPWTGLPLWVPRANAGLLAADCSRAWNAGLTFRPLRETIRDTFEWDRATPASARPAKTGLSFPVGIDAARERELLAEWRARSGAHAAERPR